MITEVRQHPDGTVAVKSALPDPNRAWFLVHPTSGGSYARDIDVDGWPAMTAAEGV